MALTPCLATQSRLVLSPCHGFGHDSMAWVQRPGGGAARCGCTRGARGRAAARYLSRRAGWPGRPTARRPRWRMRTRSCCAARNLHSPRLRPCPCACALAAGGIYAALCISGALLRIASDTSNVQLHSITHLWLLVNTQTNSSQCLCAGCGLRRVAPAAAVGGHSSRGTLRVCVRRRRRSRALCAGAVADLPVSTSAGTSKAGI